MNATSDRELLQAYALEKAEPAFAELVHRHVHLVYSVALRLVVDPHLAEDVTQGTFIALAQNVRKLQSREVLSSWLHVTARNLAAKLVRSEERRRAREKEAAAMETVSPGPEQIWSRVAPHLDEAIGSLSGNDRDALMLRFFERKSAREMAQLLGVSDEAAQKRVSRAVERLRQFLAGRGIAVGASGLVVVLSANAVQAAPPVSGAGICAAATLAAKVGAAGATATVFNTITMSTLQKAIVGVALAGAVGTAIHHARQASNLRDENKSLRAQQAQLAGRVWQPAGEWEEITNRLAAALAENASLKTNPTELLRLRGRVARLERDLKESASGTSPATQGEDDTVQPDPNTILGRISLLKRALKGRPQLRIPEMQWLTDNDWLALVERGPGRMMNLASEEGVRRALSQVRQSAKSKFASRLGAAVDSYAKANGGQLPTDMSQLKSYLDSQTAPYDPDRWRYGTAPGTGPPDFGSRSPYPPVDDVTLQRYSIIQSGNVSNLRPGQPVIAENAPVDEQFDTLFRVGLKGYISAGTGPNPTLGWSGTPDLESLTPQQRESYDKALKQNEESKKYWEEYYRTNPSIRAPVAGP